MRPKILIYGISANPPHLGHQEVVRQILASGSFDMVRVQVAGVRTDKSFLAPDHRVNMTLLTFPPEWLVAFRTGLFISFYDTYGLNTFTIDLLRWYEEHFDAEIWAGIGSDLVTPHPELDGKCEIEALWKSGPELMEKGKFCVFPRPGYPHPKDLSLPPQFEVLDLDLKIKVSSTLVRRLIEVHETFEPLITQGVALYIKRYKLYGYQKGEGNGDFTS